MDRTEVKGGVATMIIGVETETITTGGAEFPFQIDQSCSDYESLVCHGRGFRIITELMPEWLHGRHATMRKCYWCGRAPDEPQWFVLDDAGTRSLFFEGRAREHLSILLG